MAKVDGITIARVRRQHSSLLVVIPLVVRRALGLHAKDYIVFSSHPGDNTVEFTKFEQRGSDDAKDS